ncbi:MAG: hypothetical protein KatS3mg101_0503 [Patescibacteria group bacterium]|nr:MAG: hypothetical protein KatS3mg101_0503 [Patescibacteria group bacterium]
MTRYRLKKDNGGQALLFVVVALTISTVVGVAVATRTLYLSKRVASTDTYAKVYYAAEAGVERFVALSDEELRNISGDGGNAGSTCGPTSARWNTTGDKCEFELPETEDGGEIKTLTTVDVKQIQYNDQEGTNNKNYSVNVSHGSFSTINLRNYSGGSIVLCWRWDGAGSRALYYRLHSTSGLMSRKLIVPPDFSAPTTGSELPFETGTRGYRYCSSAINTSFNPSHVNVMSLGGDAVVGVFPSLTADLPFQGFEIVSTGTLKEGVTQIKVVKSIYVQRSYQYVPGFFDSAIYVGGNIVAN